MDQIIEAGLCFVGNLADNMCIRQMTFRAGILVMIGRFPLLMDGFHAVAGSAKPGIAGLMIGADGNRRNNDSDGNAGH